MRARSAFAAVALALTCAGALATGCVLVTGTNNGYTPIDAGQDSAIELACASASSCGAASDGAAQVCCLGALGATCEVKSCGTSQLQLCAADTECGGEACVFQVCPTPQLPVAVSICGLQLAFGCHAVNATPPASGPDAGEADSGPGDAATKDVFAPDATGSDAGVPEGSVLDSSPLLDGSPLEDADSAG